MYREKYNCRRQIRFVSGSCIFLYMLCGNIFEIREEVNKNIFDFHEKYRLKSEDRYIIYTKDLKYQDGITYIPLYMTMLL